MLVTEVEKVGFAVLIRTFPDAMELQHPAVLIRGIREFAFDIAEGCFVRLGARCDGKIEALRSGISKSGAEIRFTAVDYVYRESEFRKKYVDRVVNPFFESRSTALRKAYVRGRRPFKEGFGVVVSTGFSGFSAVGCNPVREPTSPEVNQHQKSHNESPSFQGGAWGGCQHGIFGIFSRSGCNPSVNLLCRRSKSVSGLP